MSAPTKKKRNLAAEPMLYASHRGTPLAKYRVTWEIDVQEDDFHGEDFDGKMQLEFHSSQDHAEHLATLHAAEKVGMCRNVQSFEREITVGPWTAKA